MNCPCGQRAVSFGPFGNACEVHVPSTVREDLRAFQDPERSLLNAVEAGMLTPDLWNSYSGNLRTLTLAVLAHKDPALPRFRNPVVDTSRCACGSRASRWYEGGQSCWFCVPRRTTQEEKVLAYMDEVWAANLGRVEAVARRQHRRRSILNIARQTKDQYPVALRDWELWQVAKVQEDGRLKEVLAEGAKGEVSTAAQEHIKALKNALLRDHPKLLDRALGSARAAYPDWLKHIAPGLHRVPSAEAWVVWLATVRDPFKPVDPAPYFHTSVDWEAAFYKALQSVHEDLRCDMDTCYRKGGTLVIQGVGHQRGSAPVPKWDADPQRVYSIPP